MTRWRALRRRRPATARQRRECVLPDAAGAFGRRRVSASVEKNGSYRARLGRGATLPWSHAGAPQPLSEPAHRSGRRRLRRCPLDGATPPFGACHACPVGEAELGPIRTGQGMRPHRRARLRRAGCPRRRVWSGRCGPRGRFAPARWPRRCSRPVSCRPMTSPSPSRPCTGAAGRRHRCGSWPSSWTAGGARCSVGRAPRRRHRPKPCRPPAPSRASSSRPSSAASATSTVVSTRRRTPTSSCPSASDLVSSAHRCRSLAVPPGWGRASRCARSLVSGSSARS